MFVRSAVFLIFGFIFNTQYVLAVDAPLAKVVSLIGEVVYDGRPLIMGEILANSGVIEVKEKSYIKIAIAKWNNTISIGPKSKMMLNLEEQEKEKKFYSLEAGVCRWRSTMVDKLKAKGAVHTKTAALGVRGTDFYLSYNPILDETEMIVFDGEVEFASKIDATDKVLVKKGQWGGLGGRFGKTIGEILNLDDKVLDSFKASLE